MKFNKTNLDDRGVSNVTGVILLVAIAVIAFAVVSTTVLNVGGSGNASGGYTGVDVKKTDQTSNANTAETNERERLYQVSITDKWNAKYVYVEQASGVIDTVAFQECNADAEETDANGDGNSHNDASKVGDRVCVWLDNTHSANVIVVDENGDKQVVETITNKKKPTKVTRSWKEADSGAGYTYTITVQDMGEYEKLRLPVGDITPENIEILHNDGENVLESGHDRYVVLDSEGESVTIEGAPEEHFVIGEGPYGSDSMVVTNNGVSYNMIVPENNDPNYKYTIEVVSTSGNMTGLTVWDWSAEKNIGISSGETVNVTVTEANQILPYSSAEAESDFVQSLWYDANGDGTLDTNIDDNDAYTSNSEKGDFTRIKKSGEYAPYFAKAGEVSQGLEYTIRGGVYFHGTTYEGEVVIRITNVTQVSETS